MNDSDRPYSAQCRITVSDEVAARFERTWQVDLPAFTFTDSTGTRRQDFVTCGTCGFTSEEIGLNRCPQDGAMLGEITRPACRETDACLCVACMWRKFRTPGWTSKRN